jgi:divalent metal cation (Fe/Co/Zn/Cd) transporter
LRRLFGTVGTLSIGVVLAAIAAALAVEMKSLLIGEGLTYRDNESVIRAVEETAGVKRLIHIRTQYLGPEEVLVGVKVEFNGQLPLKELRTVIDEIEGNIKGVVPAAGPIYVEPGSATHE